MSEDQAHVYCTCYRDGLTSEPPFPRSDLTVNRFGVVTLVGGTDHAEDPDLLWCWRVGMTEDGYETPSPCRHKDMKVVDAIFYLPHKSYSSYRYPVFEDSLADAKLPVLTDLIYRSRGKDYPSGGIWATASESVEALGEFGRLAKNLPAEMPKNDTYFARTLADLLTASAETGNPIIIYYNGIIDGAW